MLLIPVMLVLTGILTGIVVKLLGKFIKLPYTVTLFAIGIILGLCSCMEPMSNYTIFKEGMSQISSMDPDFILFVFLPILVFDAAYEMDLHVFRKTFTNSVLLAGPGLVICMLLTACLVMGLAWVWGEYDNSYWVYALMFGGLISATDPVAVVALLQELGTSKRFSTLVDGESLLNDGTGLVCFMMFYSKFTGQETIENPFLYFGWVVLCSCAIGYIIARLTIWLLVHFGSEELLQNCLMVVAAYITFIVAQSSFDVSGVIALVVFGYVFSQSGRPHLKPSVNEFMEKFWGFLAYIANTLIFLIVGVLIATKVDVDWLIILNTFLLFIGLNAIRYIMIQVLFPILKRNGYGLSKGESLILAWGGLRGALGMSMALMVSCNENIPQHIRNYILFYTAGIVTLTLCINATTSKKLVNKLQLIPAKSSSELHVWNRILSLIQTRDKETLETLKQNPYLENADWKAVEKKVISVNQHKATGNNLLTSSDMLSVLRLAVIAHEGAVARQLFDGGALNLHSLESIQESLSILMDFEGTKPLDQRDLQHQISRHKWIRTKRSLIIDACNLCRGYAMIQMQCLEYVDDVLSIGLFELSLEKNAVETIRQEMSNLIQQATAILDNYSKSYPEIFAQAVTDKAIRMLLAGERNQVLKLQADGVLAPDSAQILLADIAKRQGFEIVG